MGYEVRQVHIKVIKCDIGPDGFVTVRPLAHLSPRLSIIHSRGSHHPHKRQLASSYLHRLFNRDLQVTASSTTAKMTMDILNLEQQLTSV